MRNNALAFIFYQITKKENKMNWYLKVLKKYAVFNGRARRKEYWYFALFNILISILLGIIDGIIIVSSGLDPNTSIGFLGLIYSLAVLIPGIAVSVRRLHDTERTGWWILINLIPIIGWIIFIIFAIQDSSPGENKYGPNPKEEEETI